MSQSEARAWWAEVEHLRERIEGRAPTPRAPRDRPGAAGRQSTAVLADRAIAAANLVEPSPPPTPSRRTIVIAGRGAPAPAISARPLVEIDVGRPAPRAGGRVAERPDRLAMWAVLLGLALMLVATSSAGAATSLGERTLKVPMEGRDVRQLQGHLKDAGLLSAHATAHYGALTRRAVRRYQRSRCLTVDGIAGRATIAAVRARAPRCAGSQPGAKPGTAGTAPTAGANLRSRVVTWYGPGMYGRRTACGDRLTSRLVGVAHRTLPCGTRVRFVHDGWTVVARVVDRGPHARGVHYDLTWAAARKLRVLAAGRVAIRASR